MGYNSQILTSLRRLAIGICAHEPGRKVHQGGVAGSGMHLHVSMCPRRMRTPILSLPRSWPAWFTASTVRLIRGANNGDAGHPLARTPDQALAIIKGDTTLSGYLPTRYPELYAATRRAEIDRFAQTVSAQEHAWYLSAFWPISANRSASPSRSIVFALKPVARASASGFPSEWMISPGRAGPF